jgi:hypothetical protein
MGLKTSNNVRFVRWWWEIGKPGIGSCLSREEAAESEMKWFPYAKGDSGLSYASLVQNVVNWSNDGLEIKEFLVQQYPYLNGNPQWCTHNEDLYFKPAIVWSTVSPAGFMGREIPAGVITSNANYGIFAPTEMLSSLLALMNSLPGRYLMKILCPTINHNKGDVELFPLPEAVLKNNEFRQLGNTAIEEASKKKLFIETSTEFVGPSASSFPLYHDRTVGAEIDKIAFQLLGLEDRQHFITQFMAESVEALDDENTSADEVGTVIGHTLTDDASYELAMISYSVGIVMGRFEPGVEKGLGRGWFSDEISDSLRKLADSDAILVMDEGHPDDLPSKVFQTLGIMVGDEAASELVKAATGKEGPAEKLLRQYLERTFFKVHIQQYRKRPVYWFLQSPKKKYGVWLFHERMNKDTLFRIRTEYVDYKINLLEGHIAELREKRDAAEGREKRKLEKEIGALSDVLDDIREFSKRLEHIIEERGYVPHIDDGVLLNMAPLWKLIPSWQKEPKKAWEALEGGDYDWSYQAMDHWPERVREKCKTNRSYAIAHGLG